MNIREEVKKSRHYSPSKEIFMSDEIDGITREMYDEGVIDYYLQEIRFGLSCIFKDEQTNQHIQFFTDNTGAVDSFNNLIQLLEETQTAVSDHKENLKKRTIKGKYFVARLNDVPEEGEDDYTLDLYYGEEMINSATNSNEE